MIIFGTRSKAIGTVQTKATNCTYCGLKTAKRIVVFGSYFHIFWIPTFPIGRTAIMECTHCLKTSRRREFTPEQKEHYHQEKNAIKRPIWHWAGLLILVSIFLYSVSIAILAR